jgi:hypothetical protein
MKYIINWFRGGNLYLEYPNGIIEGIIHRIGGFPYKGILVPKTLNYVNWIQYLTGGLL